MIAIAIASVTAFVIAIALGSVQFHPVLKTTGASMGPFPILACIASPGIVPSPPPQIAAPAHLDNSDSKLTMFKTNWTGAHNTACVLDNVTSILLPNADIICEIECDVSVEDINAR